MINISEDRLIRMEDMLTQLVSMVDNLKVEVDSMKSGMDIMKSDIDIMKHDIAEVKYELKEFKETNEKEHAEILSRLKDIESDQNHIWEKTVRNERDIAKFKQRN